MISDQTSYWAKICPNFALHTISKLNFFSSNSPPKKSHKFTSTGWQIIYNGMVQHNWIILIIHPKNLIISHCNHPIPLFYRPPYTHQKTCDKSYRSSNESSGEQKKNCVKCSSVPDISYCHKVVAIKNVRYVTKGRNVRYNKPRKKTYTQ